MPPTRLILEDPRRRNSDYGESWRRGKKVAMSVSDKEGKMATPMRSEGQVGQGVENNAQIVMANVKNDEYPTVYNDVQLELPMSEVRLLTKPTYKV